MPSKTSSDFARRPRAKDALPGALLVAAFPAMTLLLGGVHDVVKVGFGVWLLIVGASMLWTLPAALDLSAPVRRLVWMAAIASLGALLGLIPVSSGVRGVLQPGLAPVVELGLAQSHGLHPVAVDPQGALMGISWLLSLVIGGVAVAATAHTVRRARRNGMILLGTGVVLVLLEVLQRGLGLTGVLGTGFGEQTDPFGTLIYRNAGALLVAVLVPFGMAFAWENQIRKKVFPIAAVFVLILGTWMAESRGAVLVLVACLSVWANLMWPFLRRPSLGASLVAAVGVGILGPTQALEAFTRLIRPGFWGEADLLGDRTELFAAAWRLIVSSPCLGVGVGGFGEAHRWAKTDPSFVHSTHAHSEPLQVLAEQGVLFGGLWWVTAAVAMVILFRGWKSASDEVRPWLAACIACSLGILLGSMFDFPLRHGALAWLWALSLGQGLALTQASVNASVRRSARPLVVLLGLPAIGLLLGAAAASVQPGGTWSSHAQTVRIAQQATKEHRPDAENWWRLALGQQPLSAPSMLGLAEVMWREGYLPEARERALDARVLDPTSVPAALVLARLEGLLGHSNEAAAAWSALFELQPPPDADVDAWLREAAKSGEMPFATALAISPHREDLACRMAKVVEDLGDRTGAELLYESAATDTLACRWYFGRRLNAWARYDEAFELMNGLSQNCEVDWIRGVALRGLHRGKEAIIPLERVFSQCSESFPSVQAELALAMLDTSDSQGLPMLEAMLIRYPEQDGWRRRLIDEFDRRGREGQVTPHLRVLVDSGSATEAERERFLRVAHTP